MRTSRPESEQPRGKCRIDGIRHFLDFYCRFDRVSYCSLFTLGRQSQIESIVGKTDSLHVVSMYCTFDLN